MIELSPTTLLGTTLAGKKVMTSSGKVARTTTQVQGEVAENSRLTRLASEMWDFATNSCLVGYLDGNKSACTCKHLIPRAPLVPCWRREPLRVCLKTSLEQEIYTSP